MIIQADEKLRSLIKLPIVLYGERHEEFLDLLRRAFRLDNMTEINITDQIFNDKETILYLSLVQEVKLEGTDLGEANGLLTPVGRNLVLHFDTSGQLFSYEIDDIAQDGIERIKFDLIKLIRDGEIYFAKAGEKLDLQRLIREKKRYYIQPDEEGKKHLVFVYAT